MGLAIPKYECCKFRGSVAALDAATGKVIWKAYTIAEEAKPVRKNAQGIQLWGPSGAGVWSSPTVDLYAASVYVTTGDAYSDPVASTTDAFHRLRPRHRKDLWSRQLTANDAFTWAAICRRLESTVRRLKDPTMTSDPLRSRRSANGRRRTDRRAEIGRCPRGSIPITSEILWQTRVGQGGRVGGVQWGIGRRRRATSTLRVRTLGDDRAAGGHAGAQPTTARRGVSATIRKPAAASSRSRSQTGAVVGKRRIPAAGQAGCTPAQSAAVTAIPGVVFSGGIDGHLRAYLHRRRQDRLGRRHRSRVRHHQWREGHRRLP